MLEMVQNEVTCFVGNLREREGVKEGALLLVEKRDARRSPSRELLFLASVADMSQTSRGRASRVTSRTNCPVS